MRYVTNEQRRRRTFFKPTLWAVAGWLLFGVTHSLSPARTALKISQLAEGRMPPTYGSMHQSAVLKALKT